MSDRRAISVFLKQSGESFSTERTSNYTQEAVAAVARNIAEVYKKRRTLGVRSITVVPGAGNLGRGRGLDGMGFNNPDAAGRILTALNTIALAGKLGELGIPTEMMLAPSMGIFDNKGVIEEDATGNKVVSPLEFVSYNRDKLVEAHKDRKVVIIAGGAGENEATTDYAVAFYARDYKNDFSGQVLVLKSTDLDGIYETDPRESRENGTSEPRRYQKISAQTIKENYSRLHAVDKPSLDELIEGSLEMLVYAERQHPLVEVLKHLRTNGSTSTTIGTLIVPEVCEPIFYD